MPSSAFPLDPLDRLIVLATQDGLPRVARPYHAVAEQVGVAPAEVMARLQRMLENGVIRRIGAVPNHYALGYKANGMTVWDVVDERVDALGERVGQLESVSHCYRRPRYLPDWPYNLFAMVHGHDRAEVEQKARQIAELLGDACNGCSAACICRARQIAELLGDACRGHEILYSTKILKKTGLRII